MEHYATLKDAARATGLSQQRFREKVRKGILPGRVRGRGYDLVEVCRARIQELEQRSSEDPDYLNLTAERARKERAQAEKVEFDLAVARKEYIHVSHLERVLERFASSAAARFDAIVSRLHQRYPDMKKRHLKAIEKEIALARNHVAELRADPD